MLIALALVACKGKGSGDGTGMTGSDKPAEKPVTRPVKKVDGPSVAPIVTSNVTFVVPKASAWWGEMSFACYRAVMSLSGSARPGDAFEKLSPNVVPAMTAAGIDLGRDLEAVGAYDCGNGSPCFYVAGHLEHPEKMGEVLKILIPTAPPKDLGGGHYVTETQGVNGPRTIHLRVVPIQWGPELPDDRWSRQLGDATHVVFVGGIDGKNADLDPLAGVADAKAAAERVKYDEGVLADPHGRCIVGDVGPRDFQPGFTLDHARFGIAAPEGAANDALMTLMGSKRTLDTEVELLLSPAPSEAVIDGWISQAKMFLTMMGGQVRSQLSAGGDLMDVYFDMIALIGERAFRHDLKGKALALSWRTDRVPQTDLKDLEKRLEAVMPAGATP